MAYPQAFVDALTEAGWLSALIPEEFGALGHFLLIRAYQRTQASLLQPFAYLQLVTAASLGVAVFGEALS